jgi:hypothetical protein
MVDLLDNFLNILKIFLAVVINFMKSLQQSMKGDKERKMNSRPATANQVRDREKGLNKSFLK